jgi:hypothetical protein
MRSWGYCNVTSSARVQQASAGCAVCDVHSSGYTYCTTGVVHQLSWQLASRWWRMRKRGSTRFHHPSTVQVYKIPLQGTRLSTGCRSHAQPCAAMRSHQLQPCLSCHRAQRSVERASVERARRGAIHRWSQHAALLSRQRRAAHRSQRAARVCGSNLGTCL